MRLPYLSVPRRRHSWLWMASFLVASCAEAPDSSTGTAASCQVASDCLGLLPAGADRCAWEVSCELGSTDAGTCVVVERARECIAAPCQTATCEPATGECVSSPVADGLACSDGLLCTTGDRCFGGSCTPGPSPCGAAPCQVAACDPETGGCSLSPAADFTDCSDDDACTTGDTCVAGACLGAARACADDGDPCTTTGCTGGECVNAPVGDDLAVPCDDGVPCTTAGRCVGGECAEGVPTCVSPPGGCQVASCGPGGDCTLSDAPDGTPCTGPDPCTKGQTCESGTCTGGVPKCTEHPSPCIATSCDPEDGGCVNSAVSGPCDDGNVCTTDDQCGAGLCRGEPVSCPGDDPPCSPVSCDGFTGACVPEVVATGTPCDDGTPCTVLDRCSGGACTGPPACPDDGSTCTIEACDPTTAACSSVTLEDGAECDDGDLCTGIGSCVEGQCAKGPVLPCEDDGSACTLETCASAAVGCVSVPFPDGADCDDGDACTVGEACTAGGCSGGSARLCPGESAACRVGVCDPVTGCGLAVAEEGAGCDDGEPCTAADVCTSGVCGGVAASCGDPGPCAAVACVAGIGCVVTPLAIGASCDDGSACTSGDRCLAGAGPGGRACVPLSAVVCPPTGLACVDAACDPASGQCATVPAPAGRLCDDGSPCTHDDACAEGDCLGVAIACPPGAPCDDVACDPATGACETAPKAEGATCDDGVPCRVAGRCSSGSCTSTAIVCPSDGDPCTGELCDAVTGVCTTTPVGDAVPCDDGDPCTLTSACTAGVCAGLADSACPSDGDPCTSDACVTGLGCVYLPAPAGPCDDGSVCTTGDACSGAGPGCIGAPVACPAGAAACERATCDPVLGCGTTIEVDGAVCDDGDPCSVDDRCLGGACSGAPQQCDPTTEACRISVCDTAIGGCTLAFADAGAPCDDGKACTPTQACTDAGTCEGAVRSCAPDGACRVGVCLEPTGDCTTGPAPNGSPCDDGAPCQIDDRCLLGQCQPGSQPACSPTGPCRLVACDGGTGACSETTAADGTPCNDGDACTEGEVCAAGGCAGAAVACDDGVACTLDLCEPEEGCVHADLDGQPCDDGDVCTVDTRCTEGDCVGTPRCVAPGPCQLATCGPDGECAAAPAPDGLACDDGDVCTGDGSCLAGACAAPPIECPFPGADCLVATCLPLVGCVATSAPDGVSCADDPCATGTTCSGGACTGGAPLACPPGGACTTSACSPETGCRLDPISGTPACDDGDACTGDDRCHSGTCSGEAIACPAPPSCRTSVCTPDGGCGLLVAPDGTACDDGDRCTLDDRCVSGSCFAGVPRTCVGSACSPESCDPDSGQCQSTAAPLGTACDDGDPCSAASACSSGQCVGTTAALCPSSTDPCLVSACTPGVGCTFVAAPSGTLCDDDDACTAADACDDGVCVGVNVVVCPVASGCVASICSKESGLCQPSLRAPGAPCDDGDACSAGESCDETGSCVAQGDACCETALDCSAGSCVEGACVSGPHRLAVLGDDGVLELLDPGLGLVDGAATVNSVADVAASGLRLVTVGAAAPGASLAVVTLRGALGDALWSSAPAPIAGGEPAFFGGDVVVLAPGGVLYRFEGASGEPLGTLDVALPSLSRPFSGVRAPRVYVPTASGSLLVIHSTLDGELAAAGVSQGAALAGGALDVTADEVVLIAPTSLRYARASDGDALGSRDLVVDAVVDSQEGVVVATSSSQLMRLPSRLAPVEPLATLPARAQAIVALDGAIIVLDEGGLRRYDGGLTLVAERLGAWRRLVHLGGGTPP